MLDDLISAYGDRLLVAALGVSLALLCLFIVLWILRNRAPSPFVRGGRNRQPRLQVLDAAAVDTRRRIVLIRRDNVEHLVMIGGPTDIVIESGIGDERAFLSARPVNAQALEEQPELPKAAATPALATAEGTLPRATPPAATIGATAEAPVRRPGVPEPSMPEPAQVQDSARPQPNAVTTSEQRRAQPVPSRSIEPAAARPPVTATAPVVTAAVTPAAIRSAPPVMPVETTPAAPPAPVEAPKIEAVSPQVQREMSMMPEAPAAHPTASLEPVMAVEATTRPVREAVETVWPEVASARDMAPVQEPATTAGTPPIEAFRAEPIEPVMTQEVQAPVREEERRSDLSQPVVLVPPVIDAPAAEDLLEAARQRVLAPASSTVEPRPLEAQKAEPVAASHPASLQPQPPARDLSDFERVLEEEMALHLATDPAPVPRPAPELSQILPETRADRPRLPAAAILPAASQSDTAASTTAQQGQEPNLQTEIARIFGEMSASRNP